MVVPGRAADELRRRGGTRGRTRVDALGSSHTLVAKRCKSTANEQERARDAETADWLQPDSVIGEAGTEPRLERDDNQEDQQRRQPQHHQDHAGRQRVGVARAGRDEREQQ